MAREVPSDISSFISQRNVLRKQREQLRKDIPEYQRKKEEFKKKATEYKQKYGKYLEKKGRLTRGQAPSIYKRDVALRTKKAKVKEVKEATKEIKAEQAEVQAKTQELKERQAQIKRKEVELDKEHSKLYLKYKRTDETGTTYWKPSALSQEYIIKDDKLVGVSGGVEQTSREATAQEQLEFQAALKTSGPVTKEPVLRTGDAPGEVYQDYGTTIESPLRVGPKGQVYEDVGARQAFVRDISLSASQERVLRKSKLRDVPGEFAQDFQVSGYKTREAGKRMTMSEGYQQMFPSTETRLKRLDEQEKANMAKDYLSPTGEKTYHARMVYDYERAKLKEIGPTTDILGSVVTQSPYRVGAGAFTFGTQVLQPKKTAEEFTESIMHPGKTAGQFKQQIIQDPASIVETGTEFALWGKAIKSGVRGKNILQAKAAKYDPRKAYYIEEIGMGSEVHKGSGFQQWMLRYKGEKLSRGGKEFGVRRVPSKGPGKLYYKFVKGKKPGQIREFDPIGEDVLLRDVPSEFATPAMEKAFGGRVEPIASVSGDIGYVGKASGKSQPLVTIPGGGQEILTLKGRPGVGGIELGQFYAGRTLKNIKAGDVTIPKGTPQVYTYYAGVGKNVGYSDVLRGDAEFSFLPKEKGAVFGQEYVSPVPKKSAKLGYEQLAQELGYDPGKTQLSASTLKRIRTEAEVIKSPFSESVVKGGFDVRFPTGDKFSFYETKSLPLTKQRVLRGKQSSIDFLKQRITTIEEFAKKTPSEAGRAGRIIKREQFNIKKLEKQKALLKKIPYTDFPGFGKTTAIPTRLLKGKKGKVGGLLKPPKGLKKPSQADVTFIEDIFGKASSSRAKPIYTPKYSKGLSSSFKISRISGSGSLASGSKSLGSFSKSVSKATSSSKPSPSRSGFSGSKSGISFSGSGFSGSGSSSISTKVPPPPKPFGKLPGKQPKPKVSKVKIKGPRPKARYAPSIVSLEFGIKTKKKVSPRTTGLGVRPIKL